MSEVTLPLELWTSLECPKKNIQDDEGLYQKYNLNLNQRCLGGNLRWNVIKDVDETDDSV